MYLPTVENNPEAGCGFGSRVAGKQAAGSVVPQIFHMLAYKPAMTLHLERLTHEVLRGPSPLSPGFRELIGAFTGRRNECSFCMGAHAAVAAELLSDRELVDAVLADYRSSPLSEAEKALLAFVEKLNAQGAAVRQQDIDALHEAGWSDEAIYDAVTVCALFNFYNRWVHGAGVCDVPPEIHEATGRRLSMLGYRTTDRLAGMDGDFVADAARSPNDRRSPVTKIRE
jgi:uncharacterized peroxidase-related enzyme